MRPQAVTFDIGGIIYSDEVFKRSISEALQELAGPIDAGKFERIYVEHLKSPSGSLRSKLCVAFLGSLDRKDELMSRTTARWVFTDSDLYIDAKSCIEAMREMGCKVGIIANQPRTVVDSLRVHGLTDLIDFMGVSALLNLEKPDPRIFIKVLQALDTAPSLTIHIGNRLDTDVLPAKSLGMRTAWIRRGEANPNPSETDLLIPDIVLPSLDGIPEAIAAL